MVTYPSDWKEIKIGDTGRVITGSTPSTSNKHYWGKEYTWITPTDIDDRVFMYSSERKLSKQGFEISRQLPPGSVLITCIASIGKNCILAGVGSCNQQINAIIPSEKYDSRYIYYLMNFSKDTLENLAGITATKILNKKTFEAIKFCVPELSEQQAIASVLSNFDEHIDDLSELIEKKKAIRDGALEDLLSGRTRLDGFSGEWVDIKVGDFLEFKNGLNKGKDFFGTGTPIVNYMDVYKNRGLIKKDIKGKVNLSLGEIKRFEVKKNDVFFTRTSETPEEVGISSVLLEDISNCVFSGFILRGRPMNKLISPKYCKFCFSTDDVRHDIIKNCTYTTRALTNGNQLSKILLHVPFDIKEQEAIAEVLTAMDEEIESLEIEKEKMMQIKEGAMDDLLTGRVRLKV